MKTAAKRPFFVGRVPESTLTERLVVSRCRVSSARVAVRSSNADSSDSSADGDKGGGRQTSQGGAAQQAAGACSASAGSSAGTSSGGTGSGAGCGAGCGGAGCAGGAGCRSAGLGQHLGRQQAQDRASDEKLFHVRSLFVQNYRSAECYFCKHIILPKHFLALKKGTARYILAQHCHNGISQRYVHAERMCRRRLCATFLVSRRSLNTGHFVPLFDVWPHGNIGDNADLY